MWLDLVVLALKIRSLDWLASNNGAYQGYHVRDVVLLIVPHLDAFSQRTPAELGFNLLISYSLLPEILGVLKLLVQLPYHSLKLFDLSLVPADHHPVS